MMITTMSRQEDNFHSAGSGFHLEYFELVRGLAKRGFDLLISGNESVYKKPIVWKRFIVN
jgi:hypothetical protein